VYKVFSSNRYTGESPKSLAGFIVAIALVDTKRERYKLVPQWL
jgi:hypothetical protein